MSESELLLDAPAAAPASAPAEPAPEPIFDAAPAQQPPPAEPPPSAAPPAEPTVRELIERAATLPPGLRAQLAAALDATPPTRNAQGEWVVPLDAALSAVAAALPEAWRGGAPPWVSAPHPAGENFFDGPDAGPSERRAEEIARRQLERTGFLRDA